MNCVESTLVVHPVQPAGEGSIPISALQPLRKSDWWVEKCELKDAQSLVKQFHYAKGGSNTATELHGLWDRKTRTLHGCAWWIPPTRSCAEWWAGDDWRGVLCLSRLVMVPDTPKNACSFLLAKSVGFIDKDRWHTLVTYADSWRGHTGAIYLAAGWKYAGDTAPESTWTIDGRMVARKAGPKTRTKAEMSALGAVFEGRFSKRRYFARSRSSSRG